MLGECVAAYAETGLTESCNWRSRGWWIGVLGFSTEVRIERGLSWSERLRLTSLSRIAIPIPRPNANATKYQRAGRPKRKINAVPAVKTRPANPSPKESLCMVMPGCRFMAIAHLACYRNHPTGAAQDSRSSEGSSAGAGVHSPAHFRYISCSHA